jgi:hypothetical protein
MGSPLTSSIRRKEFVGITQAHRPYEFGVKVSVATTVKHAAGGQFVTHAAPLPGNPYDGHTLGTVIPQTATSSIAASPMPAIGPEMNREGRRLANIVLGVRG